MGGIPHDDYEPKTAPEKWVDSRLPIIRLAYTTLIFPSPKNLNWMWIWGVVLTFTLVLQIITGDFIRNRDFQVPSDRLKLSLEARLRERVAFFDASDLALRMLGDSIYSNMLVLGAAWQQLHPALRAGGHDACQGDARGHHR